jgi:nicotinic acid phosphoribosyltransferase
MTSSSPAFPSLASLSFAKVDASSNKFRPSTVPDVGGILADENDDVNEVNDEQPHAHPPGVPSKNIMLMTDGYKFSHHKQYPVSWLPARMRPKKDDVKDGKDGLDTFKPLLLHNTSRIFKVVPPPLDQSKEPIKRMTIVTSISSTTVNVTPTTKEEYESKRAETVLQYRGIENVDGLRSMLVPWEPFENSPSAAATHLVYMELTDDFYRALVGEGGDNRYITFENVDYSKMRTGSTLNRFTGAYNVSYFTPRAYNGQFKRCEDDGSGEHIVFFGLQYFIKTYLEDRVVTSTKLERAQAFVARYMGDVRGVGKGPGMGLDFSVFPYGDWDAIKDGIYDPEIGDAYSHGHLPIKIEALPEGTCVRPGVACFKITNTHPRFYWLPSFLETLLVQMWYPITVATQAREFRKIVMAHSILSQREAFTENGQVLVEDTRQRRIDQVFDVLDFGYRGVSSHESAALGAAAYYVSGYEGSDTVAGSRMLMQCYGGEKGEEKGEEEGEEKGEEEGEEEGEEKGEEEGEEKGFKAAFANFAATSLPGAEHSSITSWTEDIRGGGTRKEIEEHQKSEQNAFVNMLTQYQSSYAVALVSDGFNIWNAVQNQWTTKEMKTLIAERQKNRQLTLLRPDSGEAIETLPQLLKMLEDALPDVWDKKPPGLQTKNIFSQVTLTLRAALRADQLLTRELQPVLDALKKDERPEYATMTKMVATLNENAKAAVERSTQCEGYYTEHMRGRSQFKRFVGQQFRILQGDGVSLDSIQDMLASIVANGFCANTVHFGSGGGMLQKVNRDSLSCAFKCCAMYVDQLPDSEGRTSKVLYKIKKDPIAGGKTSFAGNPKVVQSGHVFLWNEEVLDDEFYPTFSKNIDGSELQCVFFNGKIHKSNPWKDIVEGARVKDLSIPLIRAMENLHAKKKVFKEFCADNKIKARFQEARLGSAWFTKKESLGGLRRMSIEGMPDVKSIHLMENDVHLLLNAIENQLKNIEFGLEDGHSTIASLTTTLKNVKKDNVLLGEYLKRYLEEGAKSQTAKQHFLALLERGTEVDIKEAFDIMEDKYSITL